MKMRIVLFGLMVVGVLLVAARPKLMFNDLYGSWAYVVSDVPPEYQNGVFLFEEKDSNPVGFIGADKSIPMKDLTSADGQVNFKFDFEGGEISAKLVQTGDTLKGNLSSQQGEFPIIAVKQK